MEAPDSFTITQKIDERPSFFKKSRTKAVGFARSRAVADRDGPDIVFRDQGFQRAFRAGDIVLGLERVDDVVAEKLAGVINDGDLAAGADAGVESEYGELARGRGEQQVLEILAENLDGIGVGALLQFQADLRRDGAVEQTLPGVFRRQVQLRSPVAGLLVDLALDEVERALRIEFDEEVEDVLGLAAADGEHAMRRDLLDRFAVVVIHLELLLFVDSVRRFLADDDAFLEHRAGAAACECRRCR